MGRSFGTGSPVWFRCSGCRSTLHVARMSGFASDVELTGRQKPFKPKGPIGSRSTFILREYRCRSCGHLGWSNHVDLAHKAGEHRYLQLKDGKHVLPSYARVEED